MKGTGKKGWLLLMALAALALLCCAPLSLRAAEGLEEAISIGTEKKPQKLTVSDGDYTVELRMEGGTGKAFVTSPTEVTFQNGVGTARILWSSPNYDYMLVNGEKLLPVNTEGNSEFRIPVMCFDEPFTVVADTTAMSVPHEIEYAFTFDRSSLKKQGGPTGIEALARKLRFILLLTMAVWAFYLVMNRRMKGRQP